MTVELGLGRDEINSNWGVSGARGEVVLTLQRPAMSIDIATINRTLAATFEQRNLRYTARRGAVFKALLDATEPITFRELHRLVNRKHSPIGFTTVVHIVNLLVGCCLAGEHQQQRDEYRCPRCLAPVVVAAPRNWRCANCRQTGAAAYPVMVLKAKKRFFAVHAPIGALEDREALTHTG